MSTSKPTAPASSSSSSGFRGFADFAKHTNFATSSGSTTAAATLAAARANKNKKKKKGGATSSSAPSSGPSAAENVANTNNTTAANTANNNPSPPSSPSPLLLRSSPIYAGNDARLSVIFRKIGQKRDPITKVRALEELIGSVYPPPLSTTTTSDASTDASTAAAAVVVEPGKVGDAGASFSRPEKIAALSHLLYLHETKLGYDNNPSVRAASYAALTAARDHVPKAWMTLLLGNGGNAGGNGGEEGVDDDDIILQRTSAAVGMAWGASRGDPASEVARNAAKFVEELVKAEKNGDGKSPGRTIQLGICRYSKLVLGCKRPSALQEVINPSSAASSSMGAGSAGGNNNGGGGKGKKGKSKKADSASAAAASAASATSESEKEEMEERYERVVLSVLSGLGWMLEYCPEKKAGDTPTTTTTATVATASSDANSIAYYPSAFPETLSITRLLSSSRPSFRRGAYMLVGQMCQFAPSSLVISKMALGHQVPNVLSGERDPSNFVALLEMILSYLAAFKGQQPPSGEAWEEMDAEAFTKSLCKALRRGCCGANAGVWGPTILPIVASLPPTAEDEDGEERQPDSLLVVSSLWEGRRAAAGTTDTLAIVSAVAECATYLMLRRNYAKNRDFSTKSWTLCGRLFLEALSYYLVEAPDDNVGGYGPVASAVAGLRETLSRDLNKLDAASSSIEVDGSSDDNRGISAVKSWLWGEEGLQRTLSLESKKDAEQKSIIRKWGTLLTSLSSLRESEGQSSNLIPACKALFHSIVNDLLPVRKNKTCDDVEVGLLLSILQFCTVNCIFSSRGEEEGGVGDVTTTSSSIERFCVNDLLRWILVHASSAYKFTITEVDFQIFNLCMGAIPSPARRKQIWETILRELIKSYCDYTTLAVGLRTLARDDGSSNGDIDLVRCEVLDNFAIDTAVSVMAAFRRSHDILHHHDDEMESEEPSMVKRRGDVSRFLKTCMGISKDSRAGNCSAILVSSSVIRHWIDLCCERGNTDGSTDSLEEGLILEDELGTNALLKTLLTLASSPHHTNVISHDEMVKLVYESWLEGGKNWDLCAVKLFDSAGTLKSNAGALKEEVISIASSSLHHDIHSTPPADHAVLELICQAWAKRASRLIGIHTSNSLRPVGLSSTELWDGAVLSSGGTDKPEFLFLCLMYLLHSIDSDEHHKDLLFNDVEAELFVHIQTCIAKCDSPQLESFQSRTARNCQLVETLGGRTGLTESLLEDCCKYNIDLLSSLLKDEMPGGATLMEKGLISLSYLVSLLFPTAWHIQDTSSKSMSDDVIAADVKEGDSFWYEKGEERQRVKATVVKIHTDDFPNLYFTIKEESTNGERQTVASRLKRNPKHDDTKEDLLADSGNTDQRDQMGRYIVDKLVKPFLSEFQSDVDATRIKREVIAEAINIVVSQCGLVSLGIGSVKYDIFQVVSSLEGDLCDALSTTEPNLAKCTPLLRCLSLAMGHGAFTLQSQKNVSVMKMDTTGSIGKLLDLYDNKSWLETQKLDPLESFHSSVLMWLAVAVSAVKEGETFRRVSSMMYSLSDILLRPDSNQAAIDSLHIMNAMSSFQNASDCCMDYSSTDSDEEKNVLSKLTDCFVNLSLDESIWIETYSSLLQQNYKKSHAMLLPAAKSSSDDLCDCLSDPLKNWDAFQLLHLFAKKAQPLQSGDDVIIPAETEQQLSIWKETMDEEEAIELEEDISNAASWLPECLMTRLQTIGNNSTTSQPDLDTPSQLMGNLLAWIVSLDILDVAGSVDMRNRSHISSFIQKTSALGYLIDSALQEADLDIGRKENIFACIERKEDFLMQKVATLAVFRTVESLPTLVKTWYNDYCPRFLRQKLSIFVENIVAPATLQRELSRIKEATSFGEMTVNGSCVSREVVATYEQDECQLSVMIRMPSTFPLRNVEVDCQKTMGIPENRWRRWALQIMLMLNNQDGSVLDALLLWKQNVDKEFDGVEPCPVCYSVLCIKTHHMPNLECKTCHNRFHTSCLMKWFQSSGKSQCVLCQTPWSGSKV